MIPVDAWEALAVRCRAAPFLHPGWVLAWHAATGGRLAVETVHDRAGELVALIPLLNGRASVRSPTDWHTPVFGAIATDAGAAGRLAAKVGHARRKVALAFLDPSDPFVDALVRAAVRDGRAVRVRTKIRSPRVDTRGRWDAYLGQRRAKLRSELRRRRRRLEEQGPLDLAIETGTQNLETFIELEARGWKGSAGTAIAADPRSARFYRDVAAWGADTGILRIALLRSGSRAIAGDLSFQANGVHMLLKTGFDPAFARAAPGMVLREAMLRRAFEDPTIHTYDFLGGEQDWKAEWTDVARERIVVEIAGAGLLGRAEHSVTGVARPLARMMVSRS